MSDALTTYRVVAFDHYGEAVEILDLANREAARRLARKLTRNADVSYASVVQEDRLDIFARGKNRLRIKRTP